MGYRDWSKNKSLTSRSPFSGLYPTSHSMCQPQLMWLIIFFKYLLFQNFVSISRRRAHGSSPCTWVGLCDSYLIDYGWSNAVWFLRLSFSWDPDLGTCPLSVRKIRFSLLSFLYSLCPANSHSSSYITSSGKPFHSIQVWVQSSPLGIS